MSVHKSFAQRLAGLPLKLFERSCRIPEDPVTAHGIDRQRPVVYALKTESLADLLTLERHCHELGLPSPFEPLQIGAETLPRAVCLERPAPPFCGQPTQLPSLGQFTQLLKAHQRDAELDIQLLPVTFMWGRLAPREQGSVFSVIGDHEAPSWLRKSLMVTLLGRDCFVRIAAPVSLRWICDTHGADEASARKLGRIARVHFYRQRLAATGPQLADRKKLFQQILRSDNIKAALQEEASTKKVSLEQAEQSALKYLDEIAADYSNTLIRLLDRSMTWIWNKIYSGINVHNAERVRQLAQSGYEIVYVPCHRSHMDYLLLSYVLYYEGLVPPHIAAGVNLNFWPAGPIFRRGGAFFMRRTFRGNKLYSSIFKEYLATLFERGYSVEYFIEGGRSRTGRLLPPKTGMLAMTVQTWLRGLKRPIAFVPIYLGYEHVMEIGTYAKELRGKRKEKESAWHLIGIIRKLRNFGQGYVNFAEPIYLNQFFDQHVDNWREAADSDEQKPNWLTPTINALANRIMTEVNNAGAFNGLNLMALSLLAAPRRSLPREVLHQQIALLQGLAQAAPYHSNATSITLSPTQVIDNALAMEKFEQSRDGAGQIISLSDDEAALMTYYRNNVLHMVIIPALMAAVVVHQQQVSREELWQTVAQFYPMLQSELFMDWDQQALLQQFEQILAFFIEQQLVVEARDLLCAPQHQSAELQAMTLLANCANETLLRSAIVLTQLVQQPDRPRADVESLALTAGKRLEEIHGIFAPEFFDKKAYSALISSLKELGLLDDNAAAKAQLQQLEHRVVHLISSDTHHTILQVSQAAL